MAFSNRKEGERRLQEMSTECKGKLCIVNLLAVLIMCILILWVGRVQAQKKYPARAVNIIVPATAGGATDLLGRVISAYMSRRWEIPLNVINKPGGNYVPGTLELYNAAPDGYTCLVDAPASSSGLVVSVKNLPFKVTDRSFIASITLVPLMLAVPSVSPFRSLKDVEIEAKRDPEHFTWTSLGGSSTPDIVIRQFFRAIGVDVLRTKPIMSQGGSQAVILTAGGSVKLGSATIYIIVFASYKGRDDKAFGEHE